MRMDSLVLACLIGCSGSPSSTTSVAPTPTPAPPVVAIPVVDAQPVVPVEPAPLPAPPEPAVLADCKSLWASEGASNARPEVPEPDRKIKKPAVAYIYFGSLVEGSDITRLETAVANKLGKATGLPVVTAAELAAARALVAQNKLHPKAPSCGRPPLLTAVVAFKRKRIVLAEVKTECFDDRCGVLVEYVHFGNSEDYSSETHLETMFGAVANADATAADYIAAVARFEPAELSSIHEEYDAAEKGDRVYTSFAKLADEDGWLDATNTLNSKTVDAAADCVDAPASFDATFTIMRDGKTKDVALTPVTAPPTGTKVTACVKAALEATPWVCPRDGKSAKITVRMCVAPKPH